MPERSLEVIEEFLRADERAVAQNAVTALAAVASPTSVRRLVEVALGARTPALREHALKELARLDEPLLAQALEWLHASLGDKEAAGRAYRALGALHARGLPVGPPRLPLRVRWNLAGELQRVTTSSRVQAVVHAAMRAALAGVLLLAWPYLALGYTPPLRGALVFGMVAFASAVALGTLVASRSVPYHQYPDPAIALAREPAMAAARAVLLGPMLIAGMMLLPNQTSWYQAGMWPVLAGGLAAVALTCLACAFARLGTLVASGVGGGRGLRIVAQSVAGTSLGLIVLTTAGVAATAFVWNRSGWSVFVAMVDLAWFLLLPAVGAVAHACAAADWPKGKPVSGRGRRPVPLGPVALYSAHGRIATAAAALVLVAGLGIATAWQPKPQRPAVLTRNAPVSTFTVMSTDTLLSFQVADTAQGAGLLLASARSEGVSGGRPILALHLPDSEPLQEEGQIEARVNAAAFRLRVHEYTDGPLPEPTRKVLPRGILVRLFLRRSAADSTPSISPDDSRAPAVRVQVQLLPKEADRARREAKRMEDTLFARVGRGDTDGVRALLDALAMRAGTAALSTPANPVFDAEMNHELCWMLGTGGDGFRALPYCEAAVQAEPSNALYHDSRGLARALLEEWEPAIGDFEAYANVSDLSEESRAFRRALIKKLRNRERITAADLERLRKETPLGVEAGG